YRMNAQSNALESVFARSGIPYKVIGGLRFYDRKEIKDVIAYLQLINNKHDDLRLRRIINEPKRGIGETTLSHAAQIAEERGVSLFEVLSEADQYAALTRSAGKLKDFCRMIDELSVMAEDLSISGLFTELLDKTGYREFLIAGGEEEQDRLDNVEEFLSTIMQYEAETPEPGLSDFLEQIALVSDIDALETERDNVVLMTVHAAKGLEFEHVFLVGMEEGVFPGNQSIYAGEAEIEEERRLAYVAITRAKKTLTVTNAYTRMIFGMTGRNAPSRFLEEIPGDLCERSGMMVRSFLRERRDGFEENANFTRRASNSVHTAQKGNAGNFAPGQRVSHPTFGVGMILQVQPMGSDCLLEIAFDTVGTKKLMAGYAKLTVL
ncbi:MAG: ATP-binding domain-containing protein, partial [Clostridia bacterium]|nr:ATP-binding domain-containing protein [Clostridia bacterium]